MIIFSLYHNKEMDNPWFPRELILHICSFLDIYDKLMLYYSFRRVKALIQKGEKEEYKMLCVWAAQMGYISILKWARKYRYPWEVEVQSDHSGFYIAKRGDIETLEWMKAQNCPLGIHPGIGAAQGNQIKVLEWILRNGLEFDKCVTDVAAHFGNVDVLEWLHEMKITVTYEFIHESAAIGGHKNVIIWLRNHNIDWYDDVYVPAAYGGHLDLLKYLKENGCPWSNDPAVAKGAAEGGHLEVLKWAEENGCILTGDVMNYAAGKRRSGGYLDIIKYLRQQNCPWSMRTCEYATEKGNLEVLKWLIENGCPFSVDICRNTAQQHRHMCKNTSSPYTKIYIDILEYLKQF